MRATELIAILKVLSDRQVFVDVNGNQYPTDGVYWTRDNRIVITALREEDKGSTNR